MRLAETHRETYAQVNTHTYPLTSTAKSSTCWVMGNTSAQVPTQVNAHFRRPKHGPCVTHAPEPSPTPP